MILFSPRPLSHGTFTALTVCSSRIFRRNIHIGNFLLPRLRTVAGDFQIKSQRKSSSACTEARASPFGNLRLVPAASLAHISGKQVPCLLPEAYFLRHICGLGFPYRNAAESLRKTFVKGKRKQDGLSLAFPGSSANSLNKGLKILGRSQDSKEGLLFLRASAFSALRNCYQ